jgi:hypothetical protein
VVATCGPALLQSWGAKVDVPNLDTFPLHPHDSKAWNIQSALGDLQVQIKLIAICLVFFGAHMDILFIIKVKFLCSYSPPPPLCSIWSLEFSIVWARSPISCNTCLCVWCPFLDLHLTTTTQYLCLNYCHVGIRHVYIRQDHGRFFKWHFIPIKSKPWPRWVVQKYDPIWPQWGIRTN